MADMKRDATIISPNMTAALMIYSSLFMRFSIMVKPRNMLLFSCHFTNLSAQTVQLGRYINHYYFQKEVKPDNIEQSGDTISTGV
ncbi:probable mitochondrial pyruvate carrier 1 [Antedon mediterranea]|uniref:probable mitochondrial pyruvate carrier 1 n=1 Tax=Antedon mediterranea TaxID=105859 RepID=UPI003AF459A3